MNTPLTLASLFESVERSRLLGLDFLLLDLDLAHTFLDSARLAADPTAAARSQGRARRAHDSVGWLLGRFGLDATQSAAVAAPLRVLKLRLEALGETF